MGFGGEPPSLLFALVRSVAACWFRGICSFVWTGRRAPARRAPRPPYRPDIPGQPGTRQWPGLVAPNLTCTRCCLVSDHSHPCQPSKCRNAWPRAAYRRKFVCNCAIPGAAMQPRFRAAAANTWR
eukprot:832454-Prymnesium_polylepis.4